MSTEQFEKLTKRLDYIEFRQWGAFGGSNVKGCYIVLQQS